MAPLDSAAESAAESATALQDTLTFVDQKLHGERLTVESADKKWPLGRSILFVLVTSFVLWIGIYFGISAVFKTLPGNSTATAAQVNQNGWKWAENRVFSASQEVPLPFVTPDHLDLARSRVGPHLPPLVSRHTPVPAHDHGIPPIR